MCAVLKKNNIENLQSLNFVCVFNQETLSQCSICDLKLRLFITMGPGRLCFCDQS